MSTQKKKNLDETRVKISKDRGPIGLPLLAEVLNWDAERLNLSKYKEGDYRRFLLVENPRLKTNGWRKDLREVQNEIRKDLIGILKPEPVTGWRATDPNCRHVSPRRWALGDLIVKLNGFSWKEYLHIYPAPKPVARFVVHYLEREQVINCGMPEIDSEKFSIYESVSFGGNTTRKEFLRDRLYRIIYTALKTGEISRLRLCEYGKCQNFFVGRGRHCSEKCRITFYNEERREQFKKNYHMRKKQRLNQAKSLLKTKSIDEVLERIPGLTYKALERASIIRGKILN